MLDIDELRQTRLAPLIDRALRDKAPDPGTFAVMGHSIDIAESLYELWIRVFTTGSLSQTLKEIIRVKLSRAAECNY